MRALILRAPLQTRTANVREISIIEGVAGKASISRCTFYNYFKSVNAALTALGRDITHLAVLEGERFRCVGKDKCKSHCWFSEVS